MNKIEGDILRIVKKWNWKWIFIHQGYFFRKIPTINSSFAPKYVQCQGWSLNFGHNINIFQLKRWNVMQEQTQYSTDKIAKERWMYVNSNSKALKFQRKKYRFRLWVFTFSYECFYCWNWRVLPKKLQCKWYIRPSDPLSRLQYHFTLRVSKSQILANLTGAFQNQVNLVLCIVASD